METSSPSSLNAVAAATTAATMNVVTKIPSDMAVTDCMHRGIQDILVQTTTGVILGGLAAIVLASSSRLRGNGTSSSVRKMYAGLGGGIGFGTAWTNTSVQLENMLSHPRSS
jgi:hypothetical protein